MKKTLGKWLEDAWYSEMILSRLISPLSLVYVDIIRVRRFLYRIGLFPSEKLPVPVIVIGNLTVGGAGKTPLVIWLAKWLSANGFRPGVISRGYRGSDNHLPQIVSAESDPALVGDEAVLLSKRCFCPVVVGRKRCAAAKTLLANFACDVIISDDGLQHYALKRDIEVVVIDGQRRFGNGYCLPAGPLREPPERLREADFIVVNSGKTHSDNEYPMSCVGETLVNLLTGATRPLSDFKSAKAHALAAIGNPQRFFALLAAAGVDADQRAFQDHYQFKAEDLNYRDDIPVVMTEKDAVKCVKFAKHNYWYLPIDAELPADFPQKLLTLLREKAHG